MKILLQGIVGSTEYGFATPTSDIDRLGIFALPASDFLGLNPPIGKSESTRSSNNPDTTMHEILKFARLCLGANPTVSELLYLNPELYEVMTPLGEQLIGIRKSFLSAKRVKEAFCGYSYSQLKELERRGDYGPYLKKRTAKHSRHLARILDSGFELWSTGEMQVRRPNPQEYFDFGNQVAAGNIDLARKRFSNMADLFDTTPTVLPDEPCLGTVDDWIRAVRSWYPVDNV